MLVGAGVAVAGAVKRVAPPDIQSSIKDARPTTSPKSATGPAQESRHRAQLVPCEHHVWLRGEPRVLITKSVRCPHVSCGGSVRSIGFILH
jgi:hypothetical protein